MPLRKVLLMLAYVQKWGNSLGIRIPRSLIQRVGLAEGAPVDLEVGDDGLIIRPRRCSLEMLLSQVTEDNLHREVDTGQPVGREVW